ncbi:hypothetical protein QAD02_003283 [Eretmocerus hayati]|uniref:Uncharacterized protein n=1 Tax=Eretmocerus hayati TaxID=131215 RepID=A0ACC2NL83_9HYME|nr:hypothetical protein QAD02_003283 [Eretmocerus hayati]
MRMFQPKFCLRSWTKLIRAIQYYKECGTLSPARHERAELKRKRARESFTSGEGLDNHDDSQGDSQQDEEEEYQPHQKKRKTIPEKANLTVYARELASEILEREDYEDLSRASSQSDKSIAGATIPGLSPRRSRSRSPSRSPTRAVSRSASRSPTRSRTRSPRRSPWGSSQRSPSRSPQRSPSRSPQRSPSRSRQRSPSRSSQRSPRRPRSLSPAQSPRPTSPLATLETDDLGEIVGLWMRVDRLTKKLENKDRKIAELERKNQQLLATLENEKSQNLARYSVISQSLSPPLVRRIPVLPQGIVMNRKRGQTYPLPTDGYKLPSYCITNCVAMEPETFASWIMPLVFTAEELRSCSLYGIQMQTNNCPVKPMLPEHRFNACLNENFRLFGDVTRFESRFGQGARNVLPKRRVKK